MICEEKSGVTSKSQNNADGTSCVNSVTREIVEMLRKIQKDLKSGAKQQGLGIPPSAPNQINLSIRKNEIRPYPQLQVSQLSHKFPENKDKELIFVVKLQRVDREGV